MKNRWINTLLDFIYPRLCIMCERRLAVSEKHVCTFCLSSIPRTNFHLYADNPIEKQFRGLTTIERCASLFYYQRGNKSCQIIYHLKYKNQPEIGSFFGEFFAHEIMQTNFFKEIDLLIPVPLSKQRLRQRGYNQAELIATGIAHVTNIPIETRNLVRIRNNPTQTKQNNLERHYNTEQLFQLKDPELLKGKHILLIDDVITTGATLYACCEVLYNIPNIKISLLTLACTKE